MLVKDLVFGESNSGAPCLLTDARGMWGMHDGGGGTSEVAGGLAVETARLGDAADALLDVLLRISPDAAVIVDEGGRVRAVNPLFTEMFGYEPGELSGQRIEVLLPSRLRDLHGEHRARYRTDPRLRPMGGTGQAMLGRRQDGTEFPVDISLAPITRNGLALVVAVVRDLTEQRRAERDAARLTAIAGASDAAILSTTADLRIDSWNGAAERLFGYSAAEAVGQHIALVVPEEQRAEIARVYARAADGQRVVLFDGRRRRKDGTDIVVAVMVSGMRSAGGQIAGYCEVVRDQTERLRVEQELAAAAAYRAVLDERERIARELQESVIHRIFAAGLSLSGVAGTLAASAQRDRINQAIAELDAAVDDIRAGIFTVGRSWGQSSTAP